LNGQKGGQESAQFQFRRRGTPAEDYGSGQILSQRRVRHRERRRFRERRMMRERVVDFLWNDFSHSPG
jgi:hypothetical protein